MPVVRIFQGESYTDAHPLYVTVKDSDGVAIDLTGASVMGYIQPITGTALSMAGSTQGASLDSPTGGKFHLNMGSTQTELLVRSMGANMGWLQCEITFSDGAVRNTEKVSCEIDAPLA